MGICPISCGPGPYRPSIALRIASLRGRATALCQLFCKPTSCLSFNDDGYPMMVTCTLTVTSRISTDTSPVLHKAFAKHLHTPQLHQAYNPLPGTPLVPSCLSRLSKCPSLCPVSCAIPSLFQTVSSWRACSPSSASPEPSSALLLDGGPRDSAQCNTSRISLTQPRLPRILP